jgi:hypothetical protein
MLPPNRPFYALIIHRLQYDLRAIAAYFPCRSLVFFNTDILGDSSCELRCNRPYLSITYKRSNSLSAYRMYDVQ